MPSERVQFWARLFLYGWSLARCEGANLGVFDLCHFDMLTWTCADSAGFSARLISDCVDLVKPLRGLPLGRLPSHGRAGQDVGQHVSEDG